jgi:hypothetical protein
MAYMVVRKKKEGTCSECGEKFPTKDLTAFGTGTYCLTCLTKLTVQCEICSERIFSSESHWIDDTTLCQGCYDDETSYCSWCEDRHLSDNMHSDDYDTILCNRCFEDSCSCHNCGMLIHEDDGNYVGGEVYCSGCYEQMEEDDDSDGCIVVERAALPGHEFMPGLKFHGDTPLHNNIGVEFEIDKGKDQSGCWKKIEAEIKGVWCKHDGSLSYGIETCTHPMSIEYFLDTFQLKEFIDICKEFGFKSDETSTCGMHVHIDRRWFGDGAEREERITKMCYLLDKFWDNWKLFCRRTEDSLHQWARRYGLEVDDPWFTIDNANTKQKIDNISRNNRYSCLNLQPGGTIEWRMPRGSLNYETVRATIEMIDILVTVTKMPIHDLQRLSWKDLVGICREYSKEHPDRDDVIKYLGRHKLINANEPIMRKYEGGCWSRDGCPCDVDNISMPALPSICSILCPYLMKDNKCRAPRTIHGGSICDGQCKYNALHESFVMPDGSEEVLLDCMFRVILTNGIEGCINTGRKDIFCDSKCDMYGGCSRTGS